MPATSKETSSTPQRDIIKPSSHKIRTGNFVLVGVMDECCSTFLLGFTWNYSVSHSLNVLISHGKQRENICVRVCVYKIPEYLQAL